MATRVSTANPKVSPFGTTPKPGAGSGAWETFSWYFFRVSGVALILLVILHLVIMHVTNDVSSTTYEFVAHRYANPFWRVYDLTLLTLALLHGLNGLRIVCDDYIRTRGTRLAVLSALFIIAIGFWLMGSMTIVTFQPGQTVTQAMLHMIGH